MVLTDDCHELVRGWQESKNLGKWSSRTSNELHSHLLAFGLAKEDTSWASLLCAAYRSGESYFSKQSDAVVSERIIQLPILQLALGPNDIERGKGIVSFLRKDREPTWKRKVADTPTQIRPKKARVLGLIQTKGQKDIAEVLESFVR